MKSLPNKIHKIIEGYNCAESSILINKTKDLNFIDGNFYRIIVNLEIVNNFRRINKLHELVNSKLDNEIF